MAVGNATTPGGIPPDQRRRLQMCFERGTKLMNSGSDRDYATEMFTQCVVGDPGNLFYLASFLRNLVLKYKDNKKGANFAGMKVSGPRSAAKKAASKEDWMGVIKAGVEGLKYNPWDAGILSTMADACEKMGFDECQLAYLKAALDGNPKDVDINRQAANALARQGQFDQAISCWVRVQQVKPGDDEASRAIAALTIEKTIAKGGYESKSDKKLAAADAPTAQEETSEEEVRLTREQELLRAIKRTPSDVSLYTELAEIYTRQDKFDDTIKVLKTALEASGGEVKIRELLEDAQLRYVRRQLEVAEKRAQQEKSEEAVKLYQRKNAETNLMELEVFRSRSDRYPNNPTLKYELGVRLKRAGQFNEAITSLQEARNDPKHKGHVLLELGECFQRIKQYKLAMSNYAQAIDALPERDLELRKLALYRAGKLALALKEKAEAEKHLTALAGLDFGYKDVADLLNRLNGDGSGT